MTLLPLPSAFAARMRKQLGTQADAYFAAMEQPYVRGLRLNPRKPIPPNLVEGLQYPIPWEPNGYALSLGSMAGSHPLHEAGAYYLQEPSAMMPARVLAPQQGERVLDLCAAPGGKSTQLADMLDSTGLLVCNEPVFSRAQVLSRNLERMGVRNALVVSADPSQLAAAWPCAFDAILVDAPCSGEGMFRRHPETRLQWTENAPSGCATRQKRILESAYKMLRPMGRLVYSTCTLSREENEDVVGALLAAHTDLEPLPFTVQTGEERVLSSRRGTLRVYPHEIKGEGHFMALLRKQQLNEGEESPSQGRRFLPASQCLQRPLSTILAAYADWIGNRACPAPVAMLGDVLLSAPALPPLSGIKVLRAGLHLGVLKGKIFAPDHALAMSLSPSDAFASIPLSLSEARAYQRGESLLREDAPRGYALVSHEGLALGFVKGSDGQLKNHYPKGLRILNTKEYV